MPAMSLLCTLRCVNADLGRYEGAKTANGGAAEERKRRAAHRYPSITSAVPAPSVATLGWRGKPRPVQITMRTYGTEIRLRRLLCGKALPFRACPFYGACFAAAGRRSLPAAEREEHLGEFGRKGRAFPQSKGQSPGISANLDRPRVNPPRLGGFDIMPRCTNISSGLRCWFC